MFKKFVGAAMSALLTVSLVSGAMISAGGVAEPLDGTQPEANVAEDHVSLLQPREEGDTPVETEKDEMEAYLFVHFTGTEGSTSDEQIYFSVSQDGTTWKTLNQKKPVLTSDLGEHGVRDPHIVRSPDGNKFYLIATDLSIHHGHNYSSRPSGWGSSQTQGSHSIIIWESEDLVNWSDARIREIARPDAGCTWAPESIWDKEKNAYMVFWASKTQDSWTHRIYRCYTEDFDTFTEPELYIESDVSWIDTTFIEEDGVYYRFTKNEDGSALYVFMEKSTSLSGDFELVSTYSLNGKPASEMKGYEGPTIYKLNGEDKWCLLLDNYGNSAGYKPFITDDISTGRFVSIEGFTSATKLRHGTVIPITMNEYNALLEKWPIDGPAEHGELVFSLNFDDEDLTASVGGAATITANGGTLEYGEGVNGGKAVHLADNKYISITGSGINGTNNPIKGHTSLTVSFAVKCTGKSWLFFAAPNTNEQKYQSEKYLGALWSTNGTLECERYYSNNQGRPSAVTGTVTAEEWTHITLVYRAELTTLYINGVEVGSAASTVKLSSLFGLLNPVIQLGKANWESGEYANAWLDEFQIYDYALSAAEVQSNYANVMLPKEVTE